MPALQHCSSSTHATLKLIAFSFDCMRSNKFVYQSKWIYFANRWIVHNNNNNKRDLFIRLTQRSKHTDYFIKKKSLRFHNISLRHVSLGIDFEFGNLIRLISSAQWQASILLEKYLLAMLTYSMSNYLYFDGKIEWHVMHVINWRLHCLVLDAFQFVFGYYGLVLLFIIIFFSFNNENQMWQMCIQCKEMNIMNSVFITSMVSLLIHAYDAYPPLNRYNNNICELSPCSLSFKIVAKRGRERMRRKERTALQTEFDR